MAQITKDMTEIIRGTDLKFNLNILPMSGISMSSYDFQVVAYTKGSGQRVTIFKDSCTKEDNDNYTLPVETSSLGLGELILDVYAFIPDTDFDDKIRTEISRLETEILIVQ